MKFLFGDFLIYGGTAALSRAFALITFPLLTRHLSISDFGNLDLLLGTLNLASTLIVFGLDSAVARFYYDLKTAGEQREMVSQAAAIQVVALAICLPLIWLLLHAYLRNQGVDAPDSVATLGMLLVPCFVIINFSQNILKWTFKRAQFVILSLGLAIMQLIALLIAIFWVGGTLRTILASYVFSTALAATAGAFLIRAWLKMPKKFAHARQLLIFSAPFGVICGISALSPTLERLVTVHVLGADSLGLYAAASKITLFLVLITGAFQTAWGPFSLSIHKDENAPATYNLVLKIFAGAICIGTMFLFVIGESLLELLASDRYAGASILIFPLSMAIAVQSVSWITEIGTVISKRTHLMLYSHALMITVLLLVLLLAGSRLGLVAVGLAVFCGQVARSILASWLAQKIYPLPWLYKPTLLFVVSTLVIGFSIQVLGFWLTGEGKIALKVIGLVIVALTSWFLLLERMDRTTIVRMVRNWLQRFVPRREDN